MAKNNNGETLMRLLTAHLSKEDLDPTTNVLAAVKALQIRHDELRIADMKYEAAEDRHLKEMIELHASHAALLRQSDLGTNDKTRQVDVLAAAASAATLATAVQALAATADRNAENIRNQMNATAQTIAKQTADSNMATQAQTDSLMRRVDDRLSTVEKSINMGEGKQRVADPMLAELMIEMKSINRVQEHRSGTSEGGQKIWGYVVGAIGALLGLMGLLQYLKP